MVVTYRAICVDAAMYVAGDRVMMSEPDARDAEAMGRAKRYVAPPESPPQPPVPPEPEEILPAVAPAKKKRIGKLTRDGG